MRRLEPGSKGMCAVPWPKVEDACARGMGKRLTPLSTCPTHHLAMGRNRAVSQLRPRSRARGNRYDTMRRLSGGCCTLYGYLALGM
eukprot:CAMPEP_0195157714 /NCGR_PEP_ID=MMETSP0448-20130528/185303_1 /TAXON_ID=66468 /ORGANISM="Heterocapsa triquestra, Strain CCMP 448" /LENGTH=85 /DNA_ID=CAMNT_0040196509 /DNA_START=1023 /DNA_END=1280 /DNA_ORIENTATION=+